jgi:hypothetical protein
MHRPRTRAEESEEFIPRKDDYAAEIAAYLEYLLERVQDLSHLDDPPKERDNPVLSPPNRLSKFRFRRHLFLNENVLYGLDPGEQVSCKFRQGEQRQFLLSKCHPYPPPVADTASVPLYPVNTDPPTKGAMDDALVRA